MKDRIVRTNRTKVSHRVKYATICIAAFTLLSSIAFSLTYAYFAKTNARLSRSISEKQQEIAALEKDNDNQRLRHDR